MSGIVIIEKIVEIVTSSDDSTALPPYLTANKPSDVAVGRASISVQTWTTSGGKPNNVSIPQVAKGPTMSCVIAVIARRHFFNTLSIFD